MNEDNIDSLTQTKPISFQKTKKNKKKNKEAFNVGDPTAYDFLHNCHSAPDWFLLTNIVYNYFEILNA